MDKTCGNGECRYRFQSTGSFGWGCNYVGYCDFQRPIDSRQQHITSSLGYCICNGKTLDTGGVCSVCGLPKE